MTQRIGSIRDNARGTKAAIKASAKATITEKALSKASHAKTAGGRGRTRLAAIETPRRILLRPEMRNLRDMGDVRRAWTALAAKALEANPFYEPAFTEAACLHLPAERHVAFILIWASSLPEAPAGEETLVGLFPMGWPRWPVLPSEVKGWSPVLGVSGAPLVHADHAEATLTTYLDWLGQRGPRCATALFPGLATDGAFAETLRRVLRRTGRDITETPAQPLRVIAAVGTDAEEAEAGLVLRRAREPRDLRDALEAYLALEATASRRRRDALLSDPASVTFARAMLRKFAQDGRAEIVLLMQGDRPVAGFVLLEASGQAWLWRGAEHSLAPAGGLLPRLAARLAAERPDGLHIAPGALPASTNRKSGGPAAHAAGESDRIDALVATSRRPSTAALAVMAREAARHRLADLAGSALRVIQGGKA